MSIVVEECTGAGCDFCAMISVGLYTSRFMSSYPRLHHGFHGAMNISSVSHAVFPMKSSRGEKVVTL